MQPPETAINECQHDSGQGGLTTSWDAYLPVQTMLVLEPHHVNIYSFLFELPEESIQVKCLRDKGRFQAGRSF